MTPALLIARLAWKRLLRGRAIWFTTALFALPLLLATTGEQAPQSWRAVFEVVTLLLALIPPMHLATAISEEVDDNTFSYLWSRPIPRWSLPAGKLIAIVPALIALSAVAVTAAFYTTFGSAARENLDVLARSIGGVSVGVVAVGMLAIGLGTIVPKLALAAVIAFMLIDLGIGKIPFAINQLSITHHVRAIAGLPDDIEHAATMVGIYKSGGIAESVMWALGLGLTWLGIGLWRVSVAEYATIK